MDRNPYANDRNDISQQEKQGKVVERVQLALAEFDQRTPKENPYPGWPVTKLVNTVIPGDPIFRIQSFCNSNRMDPNISLDQNFVQVVFNGYENHIDPIKKNSKTKYKDITSQIAFAGISLGTVTAKSDPSFTVQIGGKNKIRNTGPGKITQGDLVIIKPPPPGIAYTQDAYNPYDTTRGKGNNDRLLCQLVPFLPVEYTKEMVKNMFFAMDYDDQTIQQNVEKINEKELLERFKTFMLSMVHLLNIIHMLNEGDTVLDRHTGETSDNLAAILTIVNNKDLKYKLNEDDDKNYTLMQLLLKTLMPSDHSDNKFFNKIEKEQFVDGQNKQSFRSSKNSLLTFTGLVRGASESIRNRIAGIALTSANPGEMFSIKIGSTYII